MSWIKKFTKENKEVVISVCGVLLTLIFLLAALLAWFAMENADATNIALGIGKISYTMPTADDTFYRTFVEDDEEYADDDPDIEDGNYIPATSISNVLAGGVAITPVNGEYVYELAQYTKTRLALGLNPINSTDKKSFDTSNPTIIKVSTYGVIRAIGEVGESSTITINVSDRNTDTTTRRNEDLTITVKVVIVSNPEDNENLYGYLPGNVNLLKTDLSVTNFSNVSSKLRVKLSWKYSDYTEEDTIINDRKQISISTLLESGTHTENISYSSSVKCPLSSTLTDKFTFVPAYSSDITLLDSKGQEWTIDTLSLTPTEKQNCIAALNDSTGITKFIIDEKMVDSAHVYICYSDNPISNVDTDYGSSVVKNSVSEGTKYTVATAIVTNTEYAAFSTRKVFTVSVNVQARQAEFYDETNWFDVYCTNTSHTIS